MSKARGEGAQRAEPLALLGHRIENLDALGHHLEYGIAERRIRGKHPPKRLVGQREHPGIGQRPPRGQEGLTQEKRYLRKELAGAVGVTLLRGSQTRDRWAHLLAHRPRRRV